MLFDGLTNEQVAEMSREDFSAARQSRMEIEERKLNSYRMYRAFRKELQNGGKGAANGPFGWSRLTEPIVFLIVETILPRIGIDPPTITATAANPQAVPYQQAKQLRLNQHMRLSNMQQELLLGIKQFLILGDGPLKTRWDTEIGGPAMLAIDWFDWFVSPDADRWWTAETLYHRTWHTERSLKALAERDRKREGGPLYDLDALEQVAYGTSKDRDDSTYAARREATGLGTASWADNNGPIALVEAHYRDGSMAVIAGDETPIAVRVVREPQFIDPKGRVFRPFSVLQNTPDLFQPYGIGDAEMIEDHQHESSTIKNQAIDQATRNINAPKAFDQTKMGASDVQAAWSQPGGLLPVNGDPKDAVTMYPPGQMSGDVERILDHNRRSAQEIAGVPDLAQGIASVNDQTATEFAGLREELNIRFRFKLKLVQLGMQTVACHYDWLDRMIGASSVSVPLDKGFQIGPESRGITPVGDGFARVDTSANAGGNEYEIELDAGTMAPPAQGQQAQKLRALISDLSIPPFAAMVNWPELLRSLVEAHGLEPERIVAAPPAMGAPMLGPDGLPLPAPPPGAGMPGQPPGAPGPPQNGAAPELPVAA